MRHSILCETVKTKQFQFINVLNHYFNHNDLFKYIITLHYRAYSRIGNTIVSIIKL